MEDRKKISVAVLIWLTKTNNYRLSLVESLRMQMSFTEALYYLGALITWLFWHRLWIRQDEKHISLDLNWRLLWSDELIMNYYVGDVTRRRQLAHVRNLSYIP